MSNVKFIFIIVVICFCVGMFMPESRDSIREDAYEEGYNQGYEDAKEDIRDDPSIIFDIEYNYNETEDDYYDESELEEDWGEY